MENNEKFTFTYSPKQQKEVEAIRSHYILKSEDPMETLRQLHKRPTQKAMGWSIAVGTVGALMMGSGMSLVMTELGDLIGKYAMPVGIGIGVVGMMLAALSYPLYRHTLRKNREKIAPRILELTDRLLK